jgi:hypothetical protein
MSQRRTVDPAPEMVELFRQGRELQAEGYDDVDAEGPKPDESWTLAAAPWLDVDQGHLWRRVGL